MPLKIPFFWLGKWKHPVYGEVNITEQTFAQIVENFKKNILGRPPFVRIGHDKPGAQQFGYAPAEGWVLARRLYWIWAQRWIIKIILRLTAISASRLTARLH